MAITTDPIVPGSNPEVHGEHFRAFEDYKRTHGAEFAEGYATYRRSLELAIAWHDPNYHNSAITRRRIEMIEEARRVLVARIPAHQSIPGNRGGDDRTLNARQKLISSFQPSTADEVAVVNREWEMVSQLIRTREIEQVIHTASEQRLIAVAANAELLPEVAQSINPEAYLSEIIDLVIDRLAAVGHDGAARVIADEKTDEFKKAWGRVLSEALEGAVSIGALSYLAQVDPDGASTIATSDAFVDSYKVDVEVDRLDKIARSASKGA
ncbi:hypothetical protein [Microbacterium sp. NPDC087868]|uniref:hypothetical protein n=1 Tax=Microbacterium sp. NPDC087868 TaxID=3364195 RepID=UPI003850AC31